MRISFEWRSQLPSRFEDGRSVVSNPLFIELMMDRYASGAKINFLAIY